MIYNRLRNRLRRRHLAKMKDAMQAALDEFDWAKAVHFTNEYWRSQGKDIRATLVNATSGIFEISHASECGSVYVTSLARSEWLYAKGFKERARQLAKSYAIDNIQFKDHDIVIDCGANYGDLILYFNSLGIKIDYIGIEPSPVDFECLSLNLRDSAHLVRLENIALSNAAGSMELYVDRERASSSLIEPPLYSETISVKTESLDLLCRRLGIDGKPIKLFKLEAEGAEPEICKGLGQVLENVHYIAADLGPERGVGEECTAAEVINFLLGRGFEIVNVGDRFSLRILFMNKFIKS